VLGYVIPLTLTGSGRGVRKADRTVTRQLHAA
jgi:hypothetical protein